MNAELWNQLPVYRKIENELKHYIVKHKLKRHDRLPSESQLAAEYGASIGTVRKALNNLEAEKVIYRRHGQGTFVAPRSRRGKILLVSNIERFYDVTHPQYLDFFLGTLSCANAENLAFEPCIVESEDFLNNLDDVCMVYPEVAGVIFFRGFSNNLLPAVAALQRQKLPFMYYGANIYPEIHQLCPAVFHNENQIAAIMADYYRRRNYHRVAALVNPQDMIGKKRAELLDSELRRHQIECRQMSLAPNRLPEIAASFDVIHCATDDIAVQVIQQLERNHHLSVPGDIAVSGIDNTPFGTLFQPGLTTIDLCNRANGRLVMKTFSEYLSRTNQKPFYLDGKLELIERESC